MNKRIGVAILANDGIYDWLLPFLDSYRQHNPALPTFLIPFDERMERTRRAAQAYDVAIVREDFSRIDQFARMLYPFNRQRYQHRLRKFHCLDLPLDEVMYVDVDTLIYRDLSPLFGRVEAGCAEFIIASTSPDWVYSDKARDHPKLAHAVRFSDGFFITSPRLLSLADVIGTVSAHLPVFRAVRKSHTYAQPVLNFVVHQRGLRIASLTELLPEASCETFYQAQGIRFTDAGPLDPYGRAIYLAHWAGAKELPRQGTFDRHWLEHAARAAQRLG